MKGRRWIGTWALTGLAIAAMVGGINFWIDPLGFFDHSHRYNSLQTAFNERAQKSVYLKHRADMGDIDTLLLGSSRITYYNQNRFKSLRVFNYAVSDVVPSEYGDFIDFAQTLKQGSFDNIILGLDFHGTRVPDEGRSAGNREILDDVDSNRIALKYLSTNMLSHSLRNAGNALFDAAGHRAYNRENVVLVDRFPAKAVEREAKLRSALYWREMCNNDGYRGILQELKDSYESNFIVFTTPLADPFLASIYRDIVLRSDYMRWIRDMVSVFGKVYFFTMPSDLSINYSTLSQDGDHYYPETGEEISDIITGKRDIRGYGAVVTEHNIDQFLEDLEVRTEEYSAPDTAE